MTESAYGIPPRAVGGRWQAGTPRERLDGYFPSRAFQAPREGWHRGRRVLLWAPGDTWAQGLVEAVTGEAGADVTVTPVLPDGTIDRVRHAQTVTAHADAELRAAAEEIRDATRNLFQMGLSQQDVAAILGVSRQRVSQLLKA